MYIATRRACLEAREAGFLVLNIIATLFGMVFLEFSQILALYAIQLHCLFDEIRIIFKPLTIAIFQLCLLPKMRLSVELEGRFTGY